MLLKLFTRFNAREHSAIYILATVSNLLISIPEYLAVHSAAVSNIPIESGTARLIARYGLGLGLTMDFLWTMLIFQAILIVIVLNLAGSALIEKRWRWPYTFVGMFATGFVGYWIGVKFLRTLNWYSLLQNSGIDGSSVYWDLFWFGLGATICYVAMIIVLRRSYDRLATVKAAPSRMLVRAFDA